MGLFSKLFGKEDGKQTNSNSVARSQTSNRVTRVETPAQQSDYNSRASQESHVVTRKPQAMQQPARRAVRKPTSPGQLQLRREDPPRKHDYDDFER